jgi:hypothetical protein
MDQSSDQGNTSSGSSGFGLINVVFVLFGLVAIYYLYRFLYSTAGSSAATVISKQQSASMPVTTTKFPTPFEGGEYSVNTWLYVSSFNKNRNTRKHVLELKGQYFSTLLIALGAFKNTLTVRTHTVDVVSGFQSGAGTGTGTGGTGTGTAGTGRGTGTGTGRGTGTGGTGTGTTTTTTTSTTTTTDTPNSGQSGSLSSSNVGALFAPMAMDDELLPPPVCDLPEIDLQRWTMITVVISGRTIDVYMDGKLSRSCTTSSYYKVDPTGVTLSIAERGGFDGYIGNTSMGAYSMNPDEIYRAYLSGPQGASMDIFAWIASIFKGANSS